MSSVSNSIFGIENAYVRYMRVFDNNLLVTSETEEAPIVCFNADTLERKWEYKGVETPKEEDDVLESATHPEARHFSSPVYCTDSKKLVCLETKEWHRSYKGLIMHVISLEDGSCIGKSVLDEFPNCTVINVIGERIFRYPYRSNVVQEVSFDGKVIQNISFNYAICDPFSSFDSLFVGYMKKPKLEQDIGTKLEPLSCKIFNIFIDRHYLIFSIYSRPKKTLEIGTVDLNSIKPLEKYIVAKDVQFDKENFRIDSMARNGDSVYFSKLNNLYHLSLKEERLCFLGNRIEKIGMQTLFTTEEFLIGATLPRDCSPTTSSFKWSVIIKIWSLEDHALLQTIEEPLLRQITYAGNKKLVGLIDGKPLKFYDLYPS